MIGWEEWALEDGLKIPKSSLRGAESGGCEK